MRRRPRVPAAVPAAIAAAWLIAVVAEWTGGARLLHHDTLIHSGRPLWGSLALFLVAWQAMIAAMMLPSSLPMIRLFDRVSSGQAHHGRLSTAFLGGYVAVWSVFGVLAFIGDVGLHRVVHAVPWLLSRPWLVGAAALAVAGGFQFSWLRERCLSECRHPAAFLLPRYRRGATEAFRLGGSHGLFCLGCCWALMLVMFAVGMAQLWWMAVLTAVMVYEKVGGHGERAAPLVGGVLLALSAAVALQAPGAGDIMPSQHVSATGAKARPAVIQQLMLRRSTPSEAPRCELDCTPARRP